MNKLTPLQREQIEEVLIQFSIDLHNEHPHNYMRTRDKAMDRIEEIMQAIKEEG
jgi:hypothetical protein